MIMLKLLGALLIISASTTFGFYQASRYVQRTKQIRQLIHALKRLEADIQYGLTPLPDAFTKLSDTMTAPLSTIFNDMGNQLSQQQREQSLQEMWRDVLEQHWIHTSLKQAEKDILIQFGSLLGMSDALDQQRHFELVINRLELEEKTAKEDQTRYESMWKSLGTLLGILLVILMV